MINPRYIFILEDGSRVETEGGTVKADSVAGRQYREGDHFDDSYISTYEIEGQTGGFTVRQEDVQRVVEVRF